MGAKPKKNGSISYAKWGYIFIAPFFLIFALFQLIPLGSTIYYSFFEYYRSGLKIIGPSVVPLRGGMAGTYLATTGEAGRAVLHCRMEGALDTDAVVTIRCREA